MRYTVKPNLPLDHVPLSYGKGKTYTTGKVATTPTPDQIKRDMPNPEHIRYAKEYWAKRAK